MSWIHLRNDLVMRGDNIIMSPLAEGSSSQSEDLNVNGSSTPVFFFATPPEGKYWMIARIMIYFSAGTAFAEEKFGNLTALTNGIQLMVDNNEVVVWKDNIDIQTSMFDADGKEVYTKKDKSISGRMSFHKLGHHNGIQVKETAFGIGLNIRDNLSTLDMFRARVQGIEFDINN